MSVLNRRLAVRMAFVWMVMGCGSSGPVRRQVDVDVLWYAGANEHVRQGVSRTNVRVEASDHERVRIGVIESASLQTGKMWRASIWMAAFQAAMATGRSLDDWLISVEIDNYGNRIDGPSAGGLLTAAMMAGMTGAQADGLATMTGTVNPDGSIGPVSGIPQKFAAAIAAGKQRLGYPLGQATDKDLATGAVVDLAARFDTDAVDVVEVTDVQAAYELLTGEPFRAPGPVAVQAMELPDAVRAALDEQTRAWLGSAQGTHDQYLAEGYQHPTVDARWAQANAGFADAEKHLLAGDVSAAFREASEMFVTADTALVTTRLFKRLSARDFAGAAEFTRGLVGSVDARMAETVAQYKGVALRSASDLMTLVDGFEVFGVAVQHFNDALRARTTNAPRLAVLFSDLASGAVTRDDVDGEIADLLFGPLVPLVRANVATVEAGQTLGFRPAGPTGKKQVARAQRVIAESRVTRLSSLMQIAAQANKTYFETTALEPLAQAAKLNVAAAAETFSDPTWQHIRRDRGALGAIMSQHLGADSAAVAVFDGLIGRQA